MILFASNLAYHLFWFHRAKAIVERKDDLLSQFNKLMNVEIMKFEQLVENYAFMIKIQVLSNQ